MAALVSYLTLNDFHDALWSCYNKSGVYTICYQETRVSNCN